MKLTTQTLAALVMAGMVSGHAFADDVNTVIDMNNDDIRVNINQNTDPKVTIQDYVDEVRANADDEVVATTTESVWQRFRIL